MATADFDELDRLATDIVAAAKRTTRDAREVVQESAANVKKTWRTNARASSGAHGKHYPNSITYETRASGSTIIGEIGPDSARPQGGMGAGFEFGGAHQGPHLDGQRALQAETGAFVKAAEEMLADAWTGFGR